MPPSACGTVAGTLYPPAQADLPTSTEQGRQIFWKGGGLDRYLPGCLQGSHATEAVGLLPSFLPIAPMAAITSSSTSHSSCLDSSAKDTPRSLIELLSR
jgi:hypothetical protein